MNSQHDRTFRIDRLYFQFLKHKKIGVEMTPFLVSKLYDAGFIVLFLDPSSGQERYAENEKLTSRGHRDELFKIINSVEKQYFLKIGDSI